MGSAERSVSSRLLSPWLQDADVTIYQGDALVVLRVLPDESVDCCVTSPPYWGLRDYGAIGQVGLEATPALYVEYLVSLFAEVRRVLVPHGTLWLNLGDSYAQGSKSNSGAIRPGDKQGTNIGSLATRRGAGLGPNRNGGTKGICKPKDLIGIPWRVAFALQADGWWLRSDIVWSKPNVMPESVTDRPTKAHEYVFLLAKSDRYYFGQDELREPAEWARWGAQNGAGKYAGENSSAAMVQSRTKLELQKKAEGVGRNTRTVWAIPTEPYSDAHFAVFPQELARRCIIGGSAAGGTILDPFGGSGTIAVVARKHGRKAVLIELNPDYCQMATERLAQQSLLTEVPA